MLYPPRQPNTNSLPTEWHFAGMEPSLEQLLADPIMRQLMARDGQAPSALTQQPPVKQVA